MKLYFAPDTCSFSPHIILRELAIPFELVRVNNRTKRTSDGEDFLAINPKGYVAALMLGNGEVLTEGPAILQYLADLKPDAALAPANGTWERVRLQEWLNFITSEIHAVSSPLFNTSLSEDVRAIFRDKLFRRFDYIAPVLERQDFLLGSRFTIVDAYLFTVLDWMRFFSIKLDRWPAIIAYMHRISERPSVQDALNAEARTQAVD